MTSLRANSCRHLISNFQTALLPSFVPILLFRGEQLQRKSAHMPTLVYLSLGSNVGDRGRHLRAAIHRLGASGRLISVSSFYETEPVEFTSQAWFLNCAVELETDIEPGLLMSEILRIELEMGRKRSVKKGPREIDIDILLFGDQVINKPELTIPHPRMAQRRFVLEPLAEIAPEAIHPLQMRTIRELLGSVAPGPVVRRAAITDDQRPTTGDGSKEE